MWKSVSRKLVAAKINSLKVAQIKKTQKAYHIFFKISYRVTTKNVMKQFSEPLMQLKFWKIECFSMSFDAHFMTPQEK